MLCGDGAQLAACQGLCAAPLGYNSPLFGDTRAHSAYWLNPSVEGSSLGGEWGKRPQAGRWVGEEAQHREQAGVVSCRAQSSGEGCPALELAGESLPHPHLCDLIAAGVCLDLGLWYLAFAISGAWGPAGSWTPGSLSNSSWAGSGRMALGDCQLRSASSQPGPGPWRVKVVP